MLGGTPLVIPACQETVPWDSSVGLAGFAIRNISANRIHLRDATADRLVAGLRILTNAWSDAPLVPSPHRATPRINLYLSTIWQTERGRGMPEVHVLNYRHRRIVLSDRPQDRLSLRFFVRHLLFI